MLRLVRERKIGDLLPGEGIERWDARGVHAKGDYLYVVFDNLPHVARLHASLQVGHQHNILVRQRGASPGFEDITFDRASRRFLIVAEAEDRSAADPRPAIEEYGEDLRYLACVPIDPPPDGGAPGLLGMVWVRRCGGDFLIGLSANDRGRGGGRLQIFGRAGGGWLHHGTVKLPRSAGCAGCSALDLDGDRLAVVSRESATLWIGAFKPDRWTLVDDGTVYRFPQDATGERAYLDVDGIAWLAPDRIAAVSDRHAADTPHQVARGKEQSVHIFRIPDVL